MRLHYVYYMNVDSKGIDLSPSSIKRNHLPLTNIFFIASEAAWFFETTLHQVWPWRGTLGFVVLLFFLCAISVNKISPCGAAVISNPTVCDVCVFKSTVFGETKFCAVFCLTFVRTKFSFILYYYIDCLAYITYGRFSLFQKPFRLCKSWNYRGVGVSSTFLAMLRCLLMLQYPEPPNVPLLLVTLMI